ncbi:YqzE family protein [Salipaludibacillus daqingensis]|uniref:YqzE family protein n=1 Tax=Salipaludibacillus daqingensis TaxID=3041001 RepID=UPI002473DAF8|nr:YqzE family protein [Salipaludibacillus daqingensis]
MKTNDYVKYMTEQFVSYVDQPKERRQERKEQKKNDKPPMSYRLFGMIPSSLHIYWKNKRHE